MRLGPAVNLGSSCPQKVSLLAGILLISHKQLTLTKHKSTLCENPDRHKGREEEVVLRTDRSCVCDLVRLSLWATFFHRLDQV